MKATFKNHEGSRTEFSRRALLLACGKVDNRRNLSVVEMRLDQRKLGYEYGDHGWTEEAAKLLGISHGCLKRLQDLVRRPFGGVQAVYPALAIVSSLATVLTQLQMQARSP